jgi:adenine-specific DNA-methyltransferase
MTNNEKYVELVWVGKYDRYQKGKKIPIEKPNLPFHVVETVNKLRIRDLEGGLFDPAQFYPEDEYPEKLSEGLEKQTCNVLVDKTGLDWKDKFDLC